MVVNPRWFILVLRMVGLIGDGDTGAAAMGDRMGVIVRGDFSDRVGRADWLVAVVEMLKDNFGFATLEASMFAMADIYFLMVVVCCFNILIVGMCSKCRLLY